jgi:RyR domain
MRSSRRNRLVGLTLKKKGGAVSETEYVPKPIDTSKVQLTPEIQGLVEKLAQNTHEVWSRQRLKDGWCYGNQRDDVAKKHPDLVTYNKLSESEKNYDRVVVEEVVKVILALGYSIKK